jgi:glycine dehydrogenase subunit 1
MASPPRVHPYIPNSTEAARAAMLEAIGAPSVSSLFEVIPPDLRLADGLALPQSLAGPFVAELDLKRHLTDLMSRNRSTDELLSFLGGGCWKHFVPAVVDEIISRQEFLSAYGGGPYSDHGKYQAIFEFQSMVGELLELDVVSAPTYDWVTAATSAILMATRVVDRSHVVLAGTVNPQLIEHLQTFASPWATFERIDWDPSTGRMDLKALERHLDSSTAAVYFENPSYLGFIEPQAHEISAAAHAVGALSIVGVDPSSLGLLAPPGAYGVDIACGDAQPLGVHMHYGGGVCGFIAARHDDRLIHEIPTLMVAGVSDGQSDQSSFGWSSMERTSFDQRGASRDFTGSSQWLWGIAAAVYLSLMGPQGMQELGRIIATNARYAMQLLAQIPGVTIPFSGAPHFKEFVVDFTATGMAVGDVNAALLERGILGGSDLTKNYPELGASALMCVTELHRKADIERLATTLRDVLP